MDNNPIAPKNPFSSFLTRVKSLKSLNPVQLILLVIFLLILFTFIYLIISYLLSPAKEKKSAVPSTPPAPGFVRVDKIPAALKDGPQIFRYNFSAKDYVRIDATIQEIFENNTFLVDLDNGETVTIAIDDKTALNKAYFDLDQKGNILRISYKPITKEEVDNYGANNKVRITYLEKDFSTGKPFLALEFVLLE